MPKPGIAHDLLSLPDVGPTASWGGKFHHNRFFVNFPFDYLSITKFIQSRQTGF
jgi:hypothetical protein